MVPIKRINKLAFATLVVSLLGVALVSSAFALPVVLSGGKPVPAGSKFSGSGTEGILETSVNNTKFQCKKVNLSGEGQTLGTFKLTFLECSKGGVVTQPCFSVGDESGTILVSGEYHFVYDTLTPALGAGLLLLLTEFHLTCKTPTGNLLLVVKGSVLGLIKPINSLTKEFELLYTQSKGDEQETTYWNDAGTAQTAQLLTSVTEKEFELYGWEQKATKITNVTVGGKEKSEVELMA